MPDFTAPGVTRDRVVDPDLEDLELEEPSDLDDLAEELGDLDNTTVLEVPGRAGYRVEYRVDFTNRDVDRLRRKAKDKRFADGVDGVKFAALLLAAMCVRIIRAKGDLSDALNVDGPVTFTTRELQATLRTQDAYTTVRKFYGRDGHVDATAQKLMAEAGWGDEVDEADPTE